jgi:hypothetical protein
MDVKEFTAADNAQKHENYREQFVRLKKALLSKFYLEAIFIEYTIIEDRTESILRHAGKWDSYLKKLRKGNPQKEPTLNSKINYIKSQAESGHKLLKKYFSDSLLDNISMEKLLNNYCTKNMTDDACRKDWFIAPVPSKVQQVKVQLDDGKSYGYACRYAASEDSVAVIGWKFPELNSDSIDPSVNSGAMGHVNLG